MCGGSSSSSQQSSNAATTITPTSNVNAAGANAPVITTTGKGNTTNVNVQTTDLGALDAATSIAKGALNITGQVSTTAIASNTAVTTTALGLVVANSNDLSSKILQGAQASNAEVERIAAASIESQHDTTTRLIASSDAASARLGDSFDKSLNFIGDQEKQLQGATVNAINTIADKNQSESALQTQTIQQTLIKLVAIIVIGGALAVLVIKKG